MNMQCRLLFLGLLFFLLQSCNLRTREETLQKRETALSVKEQELLLKEKTLQLKEEELASKQRAFDSSSRMLDTAKINPAIVGTWAVQMTCTQTNCSGSAVGDTKTETWELSYQKNNIIAKAKVNDDLVRVYSGILTGNALELTETHDASTQPSTKIVVRLQTTSDTKLEGQREITRLNEDCKIVYAMVMEKK